MAKATKTIRQSLGYKPAHAAWFAATKDLFNQVVAFYFEVIAAHEQVLDCSNKEALTHATHKNPTPIMPLEELGEDISALFRRAAIHAALGSVRSFYSLLRNQRLVKRYPNPLQGKPPTPLLVEGAEKSAGVAVCQDATCEEEPSLPPAWHADRNEHGTAQDVLFRMDEHMSDIPHPLRLPCE